MELQKILHGDCLATLPELYLNYGEFADLAITSPPYALQRMNAYGGISERDYPEWMLLVVRECMKILKPSGSLVINIKEHVNSGVRSLYVLETIRLVASEFRFADEFIWQKTNPFPTGSRKRLKDGYERCLHFTKTSDYKFFPDAVRAKSTSKYAHDNARRKNKGAHNTTNGSGMNMSHRIVSATVRPSNVITLPASSLNINHPAVFPVGLPEFFIKLMTEPGDIVIDPFIGSGSTAIAALRHGRSYLGIENCEKYLRLAESRIQAEGYLDQAASTTRKLVPCTNYLITPFG